MEVLKFCELCYNVCSCRYYIDLLNLLIDYVGGWLVVDKVGGVIFCFLLIMLG